MNRFIGLLLGMVFAAKVAFAGMMPSIELSATGVIISATKAGQIASITTVNSGRVSATNLNATNISGTTADLTTVRGTTVSSSLVSATNISGTVATITTLRPGTVSTTGAISATGTVYSGGLLIANAGVSASSIATLSSINGVAITTSNITNMATMNQSVSSTASPTFAGLTLTGLLNGQGISGSVISASTNFAGKGALFQHCTYNPSTTTLISTNGLNCGSLTRIAAGHYGVSFTTAAGDASYTAIATAMRGMATLDDSISPSTAGYVVRVQDTSGTLVDTPRLNVMVAR